MEESRPAAEPPVFQGPLQTPKPSTAKLRRLRALLPSLRPLRSLTASSHRQPHVSEQRVVGRCTDASAVEPIVPGILQPDARVEPRPAWREAADEWDIGDFGDPAARIRTQIRRTGEEDRIWAAPAVEILSGEDDPVVVAVGQRCVGPRFVEFEFGIGDESKWEARIQLLVFVDQAAAQRQPEIAALILILGVHADIGEFVGLRESRGIERRYRASDRDKPIEKTDKRMDVGDHAKRSNLEPMRAPMRFKGSAPIWRCIQ